MTEALLVLKATLVVALALLLAHAGGRRVPAALRGLVLTGAFAALLVLPVATLLLPPLSVPITPRLAALFQPMPTTVSDADGSVVEVPSVQIAGAASPSNPAGRLRSSADAPLLSIVTVVRLVWLAGVLIMSLRLGVGLWTIRRLRRTAVPWPEGTPLVRHLLGQGVAARTAIVLQPDVDAPVTHGLLRPVVALPIDAPAWPVADLRRALIHELEHVRRADWATHLLAKVVCALYWFHPLVWLAARRLRLAMEQACDDAVVRREDGAAYAEQLVLLARRLSPALAPLAMAAGSDLSQRVGTLLDARRSRHGVSAMAARSVLAVAMAAGFVMAPLEARSTQTPTRSRDGGRSGLAFDVASVRPVATPQAALTGGGTGGSIGRRGQRFLIRNSALADIIRYAYELDPYQPIEGETELLDARFEIEALIPELPSTIDPSREMLQTLLADRFKLSVEWTTRTGVVYALVPARRDRRLGSAIRPSTTDCAGERTKPDGIGDRAITAEEFMRYTRPACDMIYQPFRASIHAGARTMADLAAFLSRLPEPGGLVVDRTGLAGAYDFQLEFARGGATAAQDGIAPPPDHAHPSLVLALEEQLGLRLERTRGPVVGLVVEHVEMPGPN